MPFMTSIYLLPDFIEFGGSPKCGLSRYIVGKVLANESNIYTKIEIVGF